MRASLVSDDARTSGNGPCKGDARTDDFTIFEQARDAIATSHLPRWFAPMNTHPRERAETIRRFARNYRHADIDFDRRGVEWLDGYLTWLREKNADMSDEGRIFALGSFLGECMIATHGGQWLFDDKGWTFLSASDRPFDPFQSVRMHAQLGPTHSVLRAFDERTSAV